MFAWGLRHVNVYTVAAGGEGRRQGPKRQLTLTRADITKIYYKIYDFERYALRTGSRPSLPGFTANPHTIARSKNWPK